MVSEKVQALPKEEKAKFLKAIANELGKRKVAYDVGSYKDAPPGFRFWCGPTVQPNDIRGALAQLRTVYQEKAAEL